MLRVHDGCLLATESAEAPQRGIRSPHFAVDPIAPRFERGIQAFQRNVLDHVAPTG